MTIRYILVSISWYAKGQPCAFEHKQDKKQTSRAPGGRVAALEDTLALVIAQGCFCV